MSFVQPEFNTQEDAQAACDDIASVRMPEHSQNCYVMLLPNGKFTYLVGNGYPFGMLDRLKARMVSTRHIGQTWETSQEGS